MGVAMLQWACGGGSPSTPSATTPVVFTCAPASAAPTAPAATDVWQFTPLGGPLGNLLTETIAVDPQDGNTWYVGTANGLYITRDAGRSWTLSLQENASDVPVQFAPGDSCMVFIAVNTLPSGPNRIKRSTDKGQTWTTLLEATEYFRSIHVGRSNKSSILAGTQIDPRRVAQPDTIYQTLDGGASWTKRIVDGRSRGLIPWDIGEDPSGTMYTGTEIFDHPQPYQPPFFRSADRGASWTQVAPISWHVTSIQAHPSQSLVYALTEGAGLYSTTDGGASWRRRGTANFTLEIKIDPLNPSRLYGGDVNFSTYQGGVYVSTDGGDTFKMAGLKGLTVGSLALDSTSRVLYVASYGSGLYRATVPNNPSAAAFNNALTSELIPDFGPTLPGTSKASRAQKMKARENHDR